MGRPKSKAERKSYAETIRFLGRAGLKGIKSTDAAVTLSDTIGNLNERIERITGVFKHYESKSGHMIYFIMYDIENNKVRNHISKYLLRKGCIRVQKSVFVAESDRKRYDELNTTLREVQAMYENEDSIFFVPVSVDEIRAMKIIGKNIDFSMVIDTPNTLFF